jgi:hypothetical protein
MYTGHSQMSQASGSEHAVQLTTPTVSIMVAIASQTPRLTAMLAGSLDCRRSFGEDAERGSRRHRSAPGAAGTMSSSALPIAAGRCRQAVAVLPLVPRLLAMPACARCWWVPAAVLVRYGAAAMSLVLLLLPRCMDCGPTHRASLAPRSYSLQAFT